MKTIIKIVSFRTFVITTLATIIICFGLIGYAFLITPNNFKSPKSDHSHFRMQYIFMGQAEDFGTPRYQVDYVKDVCGGTLSESPIHFHDNKDSIVHLHWQKVTGGEVLKFYGLNQIGGLDNYMGLKIDDILKGKFTPIPTHSNSLPKPRSKDKFWVYSGAKDKFEKRNFDDFVNQDLETFFGKKSNVVEQFEEVERAKKQSSEQSKAQSSWLEIPVKAHTGETHLTPTEAQLHETNLAKEQKEKSEIEKKNIPQVVAEPQVTDEELKQINNLIGDVIIFVQPDEPTSDQIQKRFEDLEPLEMSVCGG